MSYSPTRLGPWMRKRGDESGGHSHGEADVRTMEYKNIWDVFRLTPIGGLFVEVGCHQ